MKKILLTVALLASTIAFSQTLQSDNFNTLNIGNIGTDITGATAGQGSWKTESANGAAPTTSINAANSNFQVVATGKSATQGLSLVGPNGNKGSRFMYKDGLPAAWTSRTAGNNIIEIEVDINPGTRGTSSNAFGIRIYNTDYSKTLAGFQVNAGTGVLSLIAYSTPGTNPVGNYSYGLGDNATALPENTWTRIGFSYNKTTGEALINSTVITGGPLSVPGSAAASDPAEIDFFATTGTATNISAATMVFDNFTAKATSTNTLLDINQIALNNNAISIYPNPATNILNVNVNGSDISAVQIVDLNGRQVFSKSFSNLSEAQINVNELSTGMYLINITSGDNTVTKKFLKQ